MLKMTLFIISVIFQLSLVNEISAQSLLGKSQILIAHKSKTAFVGEVVFIGNPPPDGLTTQIVGVAQTVIFKVKKKLRGKIRSEFVKVSIETMRNNLLQGTIFEGTELIVFIGDWSGTGKSDSCGDFEANSNKSIFTPTKDPKKDFKMPCYSTDIKSIIEATKEELSAVAHLVK